MWPASSRLALALRICSRSASLSDAASMRAYCPAEILCVAPYAERSVFVDEEDLAVRRSGCGPPGRTSARLRPAAVA
jgi:hypothetical protein